MKIRVSDLLLIRILLTLLLLNVSVVKAPPKNHQQQDAVGTTSSSGQQLTLKQVAHINEVQRLRQEAEDIGAYLEPDFYKKIPANNYDFDMMLARARVKLASIGNVMIASIEKALQGRTLAYVRLIGPGSMSFHLKFYDYAGAISSGDQAKFQQLPQDVQHGMAKEFQVKAVYRVALFTMIMEKFNKKEGKTPSVKVATVEDLFLNPEEMEFFKSRDILPIPVKIEMPGHYANVQEIPVVMKPGNEPKDEVTLVMMFSCPRRLSMKVIDAYRKSGLLKNLILMESILADDSDDDKKFVDKYRTQFAHRLAALPVGDKMAKDLFDVYTRIYYN